MAPASDTPESHYNRITEAWRYLLGENLHYGYFTSPDQPLASATHALTELMADRAQLDATHRVLDVGCGIGTPALHLASSVGCHVTGISTSSVGIDTAQRSAAARGLADKATFLVADGMDNGLDSEAFDRVWVLESSHLMPDKAKLLAEGHRALKPGGRLVLCDVITHGTIPLGTVLRYAREFDLLRRVFGQAKMASLDQYAQWAAQAGLSVVERIDLTDATLLTFDRWADNARAHKAEAVERFGHRSWEEFAESCDVLRAMWQQRLLGYGLIVATRP